MALMLAAPEAEAIDPSGFPAGDCAPGRGSRASSIAGDFVSGPAPDFPAGGEGLEAWAKLVGAGRVTFAGEVGGVWVCPTTLGAAVSVGVVLEGGTCSGGLLSETCGRSLGTDSLEPCRSAGTGAVPEGRL